ncbi:MAG: DUF885 domain-containing protein, partial [Brevundimonas sp.]
MRTVIAASVIALLAAFAQPAMAQTAGPAAVAPAAPNAALASVLADYETWLRSVDPVAAGMEGDRPAQSRLGDASRAFEVAQEPALKRFADRLALIDPAGLTD